MAKTARIICSDVGTGLSRHLRLLDEMLTSSGFVVERRSPQEHRRGDRLFVEAARRGFRWATCDLQLFTQDVSPRALPFAKRNLLLPMQEWFDPDATVMLQAIDTILCQSEHAAEIFRSLHRDVRSLQFTSVDRSMAIDEADRTRVLHIAGRSPFKGTAQLLRLWSRRPDWPTLTLTHAPGVVPEVDLPNVEQHVGHLPEDQILRFQNEAWLHIQTSEAEGFGHCLFEAMSCGAAVLTVDSPPMNELFSADRGEGLVVASNRREPLNLGFRFFVDDGVLETELSRLFSLGRAGTRAIGAAARDRFVALDRQVRADYASVFAE